MIAAGLARSVVLAVDGVDARCEVRVVGSEVGVGVGEWVEEVGGVVVVPEAVRAVTETVGVSR